MSASHFHIVLTIALVLPVSAVPQDVDRDPASVTIHPTEATIHVGHKQAFKGFVKGAQRVGIQWAVQEPDGGQITERGVYTAPPHLGLYHVIATSERDPSVKAVVTVTVVMECDAPDWLTIRRTLSKR